MEIVKNCFTKEKPKYKGIVQQMNEVPVQTWSSQISLDELRSLLDTINELRQPTESSRIEFIDFSKKDEIPEPTYLITANSTEEYIKLFKEIADNDV